MSKNYSCDVVLIHQWRRPCRLSKSSSNSSSRSYYHSFSRFAMMTMLMYAVLLLMASVKTLDAAHETSGTGEGRGYGSSSSSRSLQQDFTNNIPCLKEEEEEGSLVDDDDDDDKMTEYRTTNENGIPSATQNRGGGELVSRFERDSPSPPSSSSSAGQMGEEGANEMTEISHLINWRRHLGIIHNYKHRQLQPQQQPQSALSTKRLESTDDDDDDLYNNSKQQAPQTKILSEINEMRRRRKKGFSVLSRFYPYLLSPGPHNGRSKAVGGGVQQRSFLNENDSVTSIQMRRSSSALRPFRMRLRWG